MPKQPRRRLLTGCVRRAAKRTVNSYRRSMHLSHANVGFRSYLQGAIAISIRSAMSTMRAISPIAVVYMLATGEIGGANLIAPDDATAMMAAALLRLLLLRYAAASIRIARLFLLDFYLQNSSSKALFSLRNL